MFSIELVRPPAAQGVELVFEEVKAQLRTAKAVLVALCEADMPVKESIKFIGDLKWFSSSSTKGKYSSPVHALRDHIRYITRPQECVLKWNLSEKDWGRRADFLLSKNSRSRIASKVVFALPNSLSPSEGAELLREFLTKQEIFRTVKTRTIVDESGKKKRIRERIPVRLSESDFGFAIHEGKRGISGQRNLHAHVVFSAEHQGKKLDINRRELSNLHKSWEQFLKSKGYHLRRSPIPNEPHYGPTRLRYDSRARGSYFHLSRAKRLWREAVEEEKLHRMLESITQTQGSDLLTWSEIQEDEERSSKPTQGREKSENPPPRPSRHQQVKPVVKPKPVQQPRSVKQPVQQPRMALLQRPSQVQQSEEKTKDPVKRIRKEIERELAAKKKKEQRLAQEVSSSLKQQAKELTKVPTPPESYSKEKNQEVGHVINPYVTQQVIEEREQEFYETEVVIRFRYRKTVWGAPINAESTYTFRFRSLPDWDSNYRKGIAAFLASIVIARIYGFSFPSEALDYFGKFVREEALRAEKEIRSYMTKKKIKPLYPSNDKALEALSVKKSILVRVRVWRNGELIEEHTFYLTEKSFTVLERYAEAVLRRRPPEQPGQPGQPPQPQQPQGEPESDEEDWPEPPGM